ncbi:T-cell-specific guanine nucleotide triphosphate-binding protein 2-like [Mya arenaria]|uniref:T-cell-specific guanine nucleotide triphosphate-binding protein 2-like n=1 Tax=Mya arenaria TaxID=6604 RepID=UPI0022E577EF|nr:T-cell-specific guanine nucleotide triphosphate-binding protein 2-like [Mya arenaria]
MFLNIRLLSVQDETADEATAAISSPDIENKSESDEDETANEATAAISSLDIEVKSESDEGPRGAEAQSNDAVGGRRKRADASDDYVGRRDVDEISLHNVQMIVDQKYTENEDSSYARHDPIYNNMKTDDNVRQNKMPMEEKKVFEDFVLGSDILEDLGEISEAEVEEYERLMMETGYTALREQLEETINGWKQIQIDIAVTGESGTGKSSFINSIRGLKADDPGAAEVDAVETTIEPTPYNHPDNPNLRVWDLPGVGTSTFTRENYLQQVKLNRFDFVLLLSSSRFKENDIWLAKEILQLKPNFNLFFVRTKIDDDLSAAKKSRRKIQTADDRKALLKRVKDNIKLNLQKGKISNANMYLIDNNDTKAFDFDTIVRKLIQKVSVLKREAMIMSLSGFTNEIVQNKLTILQSRIKVVSKAAAVAAVFAKADTKMYSSEIDMLLEECRFYRSQLGLNLDSLQIIAKRLEIDPEEMIMKLSMQSYIYVDCEDRFSKHYTCFKKVEPSIWHSMPLLGKRFKFRAYRKQCAVFLKTFLDMCAKETHDLQMHMTMALEGSEF